MMSAKQHFSQEDQDTLVENLILGISQKLQRDSEAHSKTHANAEAMKIVCGTQ